MRPPRYLLLSWLWLLSWTALAAPTVGHMAWDVRDGLPVNGVQDVEVGPDGYIWAATIDGVVRFDGVRFTPLRLPEGQDWPSQRIVGLDLDPRGAVWLRTEQGDLVRYDPATRSSVVHPGHMLVAAPSGDWLAVSEGRVFRVGLAEIQPVEDPALDGQHIISIGVDPQGGLWCLAREALVFLPADGPGRVLSARQVDLGALDRVIIGPGGRPWVAGQHGVARTLPDGRVEPLRVSVDAPPWDAQVVGIQEDPDGTLWLATVSGLVRWTPDGPAQPLAGDSGRPPGDHFRWHSRSGHTWTTTRTRVLLDEDVVFRAEPGDGIVAGTLDPEGALWVATRRSGLHQLQPALFDSVGLADGLHSDNIYALADLDGALWIGGQYTWLSRWADREHRWYGPDQGAPKDVMAIARDGAGRVWVGAHGDGLYVAQDIDADHFERVEGFAGSSVNALLALASGDLLVGSSQGLWRLRGDAWQQLDRAWKLPSAPVRVIVEETDGTLWLGTNGGGLVRVRWEESVRWGSDSALGSDRIRAVLPVEGGAWVGTEDKGMVYVGEAGPTSVRLGPAQGLPDTYVHALVPDGLGAVWGSTNKGLFRVDESALAVFADGGPVPDVLRYTERDGMPNREGNGGTNHAGIRMADGTLAFASQRGVVLVDPSDSVRAGPPAPVRLETLRAGELTIPLIARADPEPVALQADQRSFEIDYTALSFRAPQRIRFQHRLLGLDDDWVDAGELRRARFTAVPPGDYRFELRAVDAEGTAGANTARLDLSVQPFLVETPAFRILVLLGLAGAVASFWSLRIAALRRRERELSALVEQQTAQLQADNEALAAKQAVIAEQAARLADIDRIKTRYFSNLSHELRTPLTLILGPLDDVLEQRHGDLPAEAGQHLSMARRSAHRLFGLVNELLDVVKLDAGQLRLELEPTDLAALVRGVAEELAPLARRRDQVVELELPDGPVPVQLDRREAPKIVANLLTNAIKYTPRGGSIAVRVEAGEDQARVEVEDTGPGIPQAVQDRIFERFFMGGEGDETVQPSTGLGLALARELTELHGGRLEVDSAPGQGSTFTVRLPLTDAVPIPLEELVGVELAAPAEDAPVVAAPSPPLPEDDRTTVLVVDDNRDVRSWIAAHLGARFAVIQAADGAEGLRMARSHQPDLVVTDLMMPVLDGMGLIRGMRADPELDWLPVVMLTARGSVQSQVEGLDHGADVYLTKPFSSQVLVAQCEGLIRQRQRLRARLASEGIEVEEPAEELISADERYLQKLDAAVATGLADPDFGVQQLADAIAQDRSHMYRRVKELTGSSPSALLRQRRLERAAELLRARVGNISEVAYGVGFRSVAHFSTSFRKRFGASPTSWLAEQAGG